MCIYINLSYETIRMYSKSVDVWEFYEKLSKFWLHRNGFIENLSKRIYIWMWLLGLRVSRYVHVCSCACACACVRMLCTTRESTVSVCIRACVHAHVCTTSDRIAIASFHLCISHTGWRRPIGCLKLQVIYGTRATDYRALLRKMTYKDKTSYGSLPPCCSYISYSLYTCVYEIHI